MDLVKKVDSSHSSKPREAKGKHRNKGEEGKPGNEGTKVSRWRNGQPVLTSTFASCKVEGGCPNDCAEGGVS